MQATRTLMLAALAVALCAAPAPLFAQGNPTGAISGHVVDPEGLALPGVTITVTSPALQGARTAVSSEAGDYIVPFLAPGEYAVTFELSGFGTVKQNVRVQIAETLPLNVKMPLATVSETVQVTAQTNAEISQGSTVGVTYTADALEALPVGRTINAATLLAPGVTDNGPNSNIMISGALSFENLFLINGVVVNENLRGQAVNVFIEDAIQETKVSTGSISAEYGRFSGGVVNMITKSGGNRFSGSFRTTFTNDSWASLTPWPEDANIDKIVPMYEYTLGGPILRDKIWFFTAGRFEKREEDVTLSYTNIHYPFIQDEKRYEGKLTYTVTPKHTARVAYTKKTLDDTNRSFGSVMDRASLYDRQNPESLLSVNYTGVLTSNLFFESQFSQRQLSFIGSGSRFTDLVQGTPIWDRSRGSVRFNSPTFCAVCGSGLEERDNWNAYAKMSYFLSTKSAGSHNFVAGFDSFKEMRKNDNYQSGSSFRVQASTAIIQGETIYPVFKNDRTTYIDWLPLVSETRGNDLRTYSAFLNDTIRLGRLTANVGVRYDKNQGKDQAGAKVVDDAGFSPRLGLTWDVKGDGVWTANAGFARYVTAVNTNIADSGSAGGRTATYSYFYQGPNINTSTGGPYVSSEAALTQLFDWFNANGGTGRTTRTAPSVPGLTTQVGDNLVSPSADEVTVGASRALGGRGAVRVDWMYRNYNNFYSARRDLTTGRVVNTLGREFDLTVIENTNKIERTYKGLTLEASYRVLGDVTLGGNYTLSWARGNFTGETAGSGPDTANVDDFPEYRLEEWNWPTGYVPNDQRHKVRAWLSYGLPLPSQAGRFDLGLLQRFDSGTAYSADGAVDSRSYVPNPGYVTPPSSVTYYFGPRGGLRNDSVWRTDLSLLWSKPLGIAKLDRPEVFFRGVITNVFNRAALVGKDGTILTRNNDSSYAAFNPFTTTPVFGTHWAYGEDWEVPTGPGSYQAPREFTFSVGFRF